jgi:hypothetical protein
MRLQYFQQTSGSDAPQKNRQVDVLAADPIDTSPLQIHRLPIIETPLGLP